MNILVVIPTLGYGGAERLLVTLLPKFKEKGHNVKVCIFNTPDDLKNELTNYDIKVTNLNLKHRWSVIEAIVKLHKEIKIFKTDIVWGHLYFGILYSRLVSLFHSDIKVISHLHYNISSDTAKKGLWYSFRNWIFNKSRKLDFATVAVSKSTKKDYEDFFGWKNIKVIYNVIDTESIENAIKGKIQKDIISSNDYNIIIPGRLHESKGHQYLIEAIYKLKSEFDLTPKVIIAGGGNIKDKIEKQINDLNIKEQFLLTGNLEQKELFKVIQLSDIVVIPSLFEAFGIVALEAMYLERPTITTKIDGLQEITTDRVDTIQVEVKNLEEIKKALLRLIKDENLAQKLGKNAKQTAMQYNVNRIVNQWIELFESEKK